MYQALYRKWRPKTFDEVTGQSHVTRTLKAQVAQGRLSHAYLFTGTRGTGKTTCAKILAKAVNCPNAKDGNPCNACSTCRSIDNGSLMEVLEIDAASNNGVEQIRALRDEAVYSPAYCKMRVYIVDEVHMLSTAAFNALLKILEEPPEHLLFILATTELQKVPATILSRCQRFSFKRLLPDQIGARLRFVADQEQLHLAEDGAVLLSRLADGSLRDGLSLLDQCTGLGNEIDAASILEVLGLLGNLDTARLMDAIGRRDTPAALEILTELYEGGREMGAVISSLSGLARDLLILQEAPQAASRLLTGGYEPERLQGLSRLFSPPRLADALAILQQTAERFGRSASRRTEGELCVIRLCDETLSESRTGILARLSRLESGASGAAQSALFQAPQAAAVSVKDAPVPAVAPQPVEEAPPWAEEPPPALKTPDQTGQRAAPAKTAAPAPAEKQAGQVRQPLPSGDALWAKLEPKVRAKLPHHVCVMLGNRLLVELALEGQTLALYTDVPSTKQLLGGAASGAVLAEACSALLGAPVAVKWKLKSSVQTEKQGETHDKLDDLVALCQELNPVILDE